MEKINCNVIQDILPLYIDDVVIAGGIISK